MSSIDTPPAQVGITCDTCNRWFRDHYGLTRHVSRIKPCGPGDPPGCHPDRPVRSVEGRSRTTSEHPEGCLGVPTDTLDAPLNTPVDVERPSTERTGAFPISVIICY